MSAYTKEETCLMKTGAEGTQAKMKLELLGMDEIEDIMALYDSVKGKNGCLWDAGYPNRDILTDDIAHGDLYGIRDEAGQIIAAIAKDRDAAVEALPCWSKALQPSAELARLAVSLPYQNRGIARMMHLQAMELMRERGYRSVHFLVGEANQAAVRSYAVLPYQKVGETDMYGHHFLCYEKAL